MSRSKCGIPDSTKKRKKSSSSPSGSTGAIHVHVRSIKRRGLGESPALFADLDEVKARNIHPSKLTWLAAAVIAVTLILAMASCGGTDQPQTHETELPASAQRRDEPSAVNEPARAARRQPPSSTAGAEPGGHRSEQASRTSHAQRQAARGTNAQRQAARGSHDRQQASSMAPASPSHEDEPIDPRRPPTAVTDGSGEQTDPERAAGGSQQSSPGATDSHDPELATP
jgi:hypothetical protein